MEDIIVLIDSREQKKWEFPDAATEIKALKTGDYSILGLEDKICLERKSLADMLGTLSLSKGNKPHFDRFKRELIRMKDIPHKYIIIESSPIRIWKGTRYSNMHPSTILSLLASISVEFDVHIVFAETKSQAQYYAYKILNKVFRKYNGLSSVFC